MGGFYMKSVLLFMFIDIFLDVTTPGVPSCGLPAKANLLPFLT